MRPRRGRTRAELVALLGRAGLEVVGQWGAENVLAPAAAWRRVASYETVPTATVRDDRPDLVAALNTQWHRLAREHGVIDEKGEFLIHVGDDDAWARVRLAPAWDLAGVLGDRPGQPEFVTLSVDGDALLGVTCEEYEVWLVAVVGVRERREGEARAAARESAEEREAAWEGLRGARLRPTRRLWGTWVDWLGFNDAASDEVLIRLLDLGAGYVPHRTLSAAVLDAAIAHPDRQLRAEVAKHQRSLTPEQWTALILSEESPARRALLAATAATRGGLTQAGHERIAADPSLRNGDGSEGCHAVHPLDVASYQALAAHEDPHTRQALAADPLAPPEVLALLAGDENEDVRRTLATHPRLPPDVLAALAADEREAVRRAASVHPELSEAQRAECLVGLDLDGMRYDVPWVRDLHADPEAMRRIAASCHPLLRCTVARARHLPPDVVERLARDEDRVVRLFLAESCDDAPADMLLEVWQWWNGSFSSPGRPRTHPNFPRTGLLPYATDPHPRLRQLALDDPESTPDLVERFSRDEDGEVRLRAATDPRLSAASAVRLLDDGSAAVRCAAARHPALPARYVVRALRDRELGRHAVMNPALPESVMHWMIDIALAGLEESGT
ncbi:PE-PGRS family protein [Streptomyces sp. NPDC058659]|uniref:PE-PGRS family protein n=1 Tax=unclassified Streptomyces TaxID=2593676 RepID=UPI00364B768D